MDHFPFWSDQLAHKPIKIPYLRDKRFQYDDLGFLTYPCRVGVDITALAEDNLPTMKLQDAGAFLQEWLCFGLLNESLLVGSRDTTAPKRLSSNAFIESSDDCQYLSTRNLLEYIRSDMETHSSPSYRSFRSARIASCIQLATSFIRSALSSKYLHSLLTDHYKDQDSLVTMNILLCCQILCETLAEGYEIETGDSLFPEPRNTQPLGLANYLLRRSEWCPRQIENMPKIVSFRYYLSFCLRRTKCSYYTQQGRRDCRCSLDKDQEQLPKHTFAECSCNHLEATPYKNHLPTQETKITLCRFQTQHGGQISLEDRPLEELAETPYIAISHVRSSGLANLSGNSLPSCQVAWLQIMANEVAESLDMGINILFWIDTLCLPAPRDRKRVDATPVRHVFSMAKAVLVLDPPLYLHTFASNQEALIRIRYSMWKERLWTLEEGSIAKHLFFRFSHKMVTLASLLVSMEESSDNDLLKWVVRQTQPWGLAHNLPERQALPRLVEHLADDLHALRREWRDAPETTGLDKEKLKRVLRLGYLSNPAFRYFVQEAEYEGILAIWEPLIKVYGGPGFEDRRLPGSTHDLADLVGRLTIINSIALPGESDRDHSNGTKSWLTSFAEGGHWLLQFCSNHFAKRLLGSLTEFFIHA